MASPAVSLVRRARPASRARDLTAPLYKREYNGQASFCDDRHSFCLNRAHHSIAAQAIEGS